MTLKGLVHDRTQVIIKVTVRGQREVNARVQSTNITNALVCGIADTNCTAIEIMIAKNVQRGVVEKDIEEK